MKATDHREELTSSAADSGNPRRFVSQCEQCEQLCSAWSKAAEAWSDTARVMREHVGTSRFFEYSVSAAHAQAMTALARTEYQEHCQSHEKARASLVSSWAYDRYQLHKQIHESLAVPIPDSWQFVRTRELSEAEAYYREAVGRYLALVEEHHSSGGNPSVSLDQLDAAKQAVERCREYYRLLQ